MYYIHKKYRHFIETNFLGNNIKDKKIEWLLLYKFYRAQVVSSVDQNKIYCKSGHILLSNKIYINFQYPDSSWMTYYCFVKIYEYYIIH